MDKIAANNHFVILRKEIKKAKAMVSGKLIRKIKELKKEIDGIEDEAKVCKIQNKIDSTHEEVKLLKTLDSYPIAKQATLKSDKEHWNKLASHSKATPEERLTALVICKNNVQKQVSKFREDHKDCDEWLEEYVEYREKKNELVNPSKRFKNSRGAGLKQRPNKSRDITKKTGADGPKKGTRGSTHSMNQNKPKDAPRRSIETTRTADQDEDKETLHPSWESKRKEKEMLKAALSGKMDRPKRITFD